MSTLTNQTINKSNMLREIGSQFAENVLLLCYINNIIKSKSRVPNEKRRTRTTIKKKQSYRIPNVIIADLVQSRLAVSLDHSHHSFKNMDTWKSLPKEPTRRLTDRTIAKTLQRQVITYTKLWLIITYIYSDFV
jgi:hypothetical protein